MRMRSYGVKNAYCGRTQRRKDSKESSKSFGVFFAFFAPLREKDLPVAAPASIVVEIAVSIAIATSPPVIVKIPVAGSTTSKDVCGT